MRIRMSVVIILSVLFDSSRSEELLSQDPMIQLQQLCVRILDWFFYVVWGGMTIIQRVAMQGTRSVGYKDI